MKKALLALAVAGAAVSAQADTKLYGHVAYNMRDTDGAADTTFNRHGFSESRFGFSFSKKLKNGLKAIAIQEFGIAEGEGAIDSRRQAFGFSGDFGKVLLGQYNDVGDGVLNADLAGTGLVNPLASNQFGATGLGVGGFDPGRGEGLRYYSPKIGGVATVGLQIQENGGSEAALKVNVAGFRFNAFMEDGGSTGQDNSGYLIGYKAPFGLSATYMSGERSFSNGAADDEQSGWKIGYATGKHKFSYSKVTRDDLEGVAGKDESTGLAYLYNMAKGVQLWVAYSELEDDGVSGVGDDAVAVGGRIKF